MPEGNGHEKRFSGEAARLRRPERVALLEVERVVGLSLEGVKVRKMLDVGTGTGIFAEAFLDHKIRVTGIDPNKELLEISRSLLPSAEFIQGIAEDLPFPDKSFDLVILIHVLHETDDIRRSLSEAARVARQRVVILEWPYIDEQQGPPIGHRLHPQVIASHLTDLGFKAETIKLKHMDFYRFGIT